MDRKTEGEPLGSAMEAQSTLGEQRLAAQQAHLPLPGQNEAFVNTRDEHGKSESPDTSFQHEVLGPVDSVPEHKQYSNPSQ